LEKRVEQHDEDAEVPVNLGVQRMRSQAKPVMSQRRSHVTHEGVMSHMNESHESRHT